jgi:hypothetical protein
MNNFEGGSPMGTATQTNQNSAPMQVQHPVQETAMVREQEVSLVREPKSEIIKPEVVNTGENLADNLLNDSKKIGLKETFKKLSSGGYRNKEDNTNNPRKDHADTRDESVIHDPEVHADHTEVLHDEEIQENETSDEQKKTDQDKTAQKKQEMVSYVVAHSNNPEFQQKLGQVAQEMIQDGVELDQQLLQEEALKRYTADKSQERSLSIEQKVLLLEDQFSKVLSENGELKAQLEEFKNLAKQQSETINTLAIALMELIKRLHEEEEEEEEKVSLLELLIHIVGMILQEMATPPGEEDKKNANNNIVLFNNAPKK